MVGGGGEGEGMDVQSEGLRQLKGEVIVNPVIDTWDVPDYCKQGGGKMMDNTQFFKGSFRKFSSVIRC